MNWMPQNNDYQNDPHLKEVFEKTEIKRKPIVGIVSGYHELPYILVTPEDNDENNCIILQGTINVSPKFILSSSQLGETFGDIFESETMGDDIQGRLFSFAYNRNKNLKVESQKFSISHEEENYLSAADRMEDTLLRQEDTRTSLITGPIYKYYPISLDKFISSIVDREFNI